MSMSKRYFEELRDKARREEKKTCGCRFNWDDKFEELCEKHKAEFDAETDADRR